MRTGMIAMGVAAALAASAAQARPVHIFNFSLDGLQEVPPNASPGIGNATVTLDDVTGAVSVSGSYSGLLAAVTAAHIHGLAPVGANAGVIVGLNVTGGTAGTITGNGVLTAAQITGMIGGLTYINVHSQILPGGEIRGQIVPAPAPLALLALSGLVAGRRRR